MVESQRCVHFAQHGHEVSLCATPKFGTNVVAVAEAGGIKKGGPRRLRADPLRPGHDHAAPTYGIEPHAKAAASYPSIDEAAPRLPRVLRRSHHLQARGPGSTSTTSG